MKNSPETLREHLQRPYLYLNPFPSEIRNPQSESNSQLLPSEPTNPGIQIPNSVHSFATKKVAEKWLTVIASLNPGRDKMAPPQDSGTSNLIQWAGIEKLSLDQHGDWAPAKA